MLTQFCLIPSSTYVLGNQSLNCCELSLCTEGVGLASNIYVPDVQDYVTLSET